MSELILQVDGRQSGSHWSVGEHRNYGQNPQERGGGGEYTAQACDMACSRQLTERRGLLWLSNVCGDRWKRGAQVRTVTVTLILVVLNITAATGQWSSAVQRYEDADAYKVYNLLLPDEESYAFAKDAPD